jgi:hypothetical protein
MTVLSSAQASDLSSHAWIGMKIAVTALTCSSAIRADLACFWRRKNFVDSTWFSTFLLPLWLCRAHLESGHAQRTSFFALIVLWSNALFAFYLPQHAECLFMTCIRLESGLRGRIP